MKLISWLFDNKKKAKSKRWLLTEPKIKNAEIKFGELDHPGSSFDRPIIGVIPKWLWIESRINDIENYRERLKNVDKILPSHLESEIDDLYKQLENIKK